MKKASNIKKVYSKPCTETVNTNMECSIMAGSPFGGGAGEAGDEGPALTSKGAQNFEDEYPSTGKSAWED